VPLTCAFRLLGEKFQDGAQAHELEDVWEDGDHVSSCIPSLVTGRLQNYETNMRLRFQIPRVQHWWPRAGVLCVSDRGRAFQKVQPGSTEEEPGEPDRQAAGLR